MFFVVLSVCTGEGSGQNPQHRGARHFTSLHSGARRAVLAVGHSATTYTDPWHLKSALWSAALHSLTSCCFERGTSCPFCSDCKWTASRSSSHGRPANMETSICVSAAIRTLARPNAWQGWQGQPELGGILPLKMSPCSPCPVALKSQTWVGRWMIEQSPSKMVSGMGYAVHAVAGCAVSLCATEGATSQAPPMRNIEKRFRANVGAGQLCKGCCQYDEVKIRGGAEAIVCSVNEFGMERKKGRLPICS